jgi:hypothetical protein
MAVGGSEPVRVRTIASKGSRDSPQSSNETAFLWRSRPHCLLRPSLPFGAYKPRWLMKPVHLDPADAVRAHLDLKSKHSIACHFGTFQLTDEPLGEPPHCLFVNSPCVKLTRQVFARWLPGKQSTFDAGETLTGADASKSSDLSKVSPDFSFAELIVSSR